MRAITFVTGTVALLLATAALVAAVAGADGLAIAATACLVLVVAAAAGSAARRMHRVHRSLAQRTEVLEEAVQSLTGAVQVQSTTLREITDRMTAVHKGVRESAREVQRADLRTRELLEVHEFRLGARIEDWRAVQRPVGAVSPAVDVSAAAQLAALYRPAAPIAPCGPPASQTLGLLLACIDRQPQRVLAVELGEQVLWLTYALPTAQIVALEPAERAEQRRAVVARHSVAERVQVHPAPARHPGLAHYYDEWYDPDGLTGTFDLLLLGRGTAAVFPAVPLLGPVLAPGAAVVLPDDEGSPVGAWQDAGLVDGDEVLSTPPIVALRTVPAGRSRSAG